MTRDRQVQRYFDKKAKVKTPKLYVLYYAVGANPEPRVIVNSLEGMRALIATEQDRDPTLQFVSIGTPYPVQGGITIPHPRPLSLVCNDNGHSLNLPLNRQLSSALAIVGPFFITAVGMVKGKDGVERDNVSLSSDEIHWLRRHPELGVR